MFIADGIQNIISAGTQQLVLWITQVLPQVFLFLILLNAITRMIGQARVERLALRCGSNAFLRYLVLPFLSAVVLGNPMAVSMGRYLPEEYKPAFFASVSYHCHTNSGIFQHINPAELFLWLGIANGVLARGLNVFPLAFRYMCAGLLANFISGYVTELLTRKLEKKGHVHLSTHVHLPESEPVSGNFPEDSPKSENTNRAIPLVSEETAHTGSIPVPEKPADSSPAADSSFYEGTEFSGSSYRTITITRGDGGYGGPLTITPTEERHTVLYMTGGGMEPEPLAKILALSGMKAVNGNLETCPDEEVALTIIDCGGTLRCGIYPSKGIPTANLLATGKSGPLAKYMTKDLYVSAVTSAQIACPEHPAQAGTAAAPSRETVSADLTRDDFCNSLTDEKAIAEALPNEPNEPNVPAMQPGSQQEQDISSEKNPFSWQRGQKWLIPVASISKVVSIFHQSARDAVKTCLEIILPFMGFAALFIGICRGSGLTEFIAGLIKPMGGSLPGLFITGIICSIPGLSAILGAGAVAAQMFATVIGDLIQSGGIAPAAALPALFAINCQCACDFIPVGLGMMEAKPETMQLGIPAVTLSRFATGWIRILIAVIFSIGLYA